MEKELAEAKAKVAGLSASMAKMEEKMKESNKVIAVSHISYHLLYLE